MLCVSLRGHFDKNYFIHMKVYLLKIKLRKPRAPDTFFSSFISALIFERSPNSPNEKGDLLKWLLLMLWMLKWLLFLLYLLIWMLKCLLLLFIVMNVDVVVVVVDGCWSGCCCWLMLQLNWSNTFCLMKNVTFEK